MANTREEEIQNVETSKIDKVEVSLNKLKNKETRIFIFVARFTNHAA